MNITFEKMKTRWQEISPGDWFLPVTIKGIDQHKFIDEALSLGAAGFFFETNKINKAFPCQSIEVPSLRKFLFDSAVKKRGQIQSKISVIGGSCGKTSVKEILSVLLRARGVNFFSSPENQNTKIALASQILSLPIKTSYAAFEVGARRVGDFSVPLSFLKPNIAALLNIGRAHLGEFGTKEALQKEKLSLLGSNSEILVVPDNGEIFDFSSSLKKKLVTFGTRDGANIRILSSNQSEIKILWQDEIFCIPARSEMCFAENLAAAAALVDAMGFSPSFKGIENYEAPVGRFQIVRGKRLLVNDAYNASPESLMSGLRSFVEMNEGKNTILLLGSILELGEESISIHKNIGTYARSIFPEARIFCLGEETREMAEICGGQWFASKEEVLILLQQDPTWNSLYIKGSKAMGLLELGQKLAND